MLSRLGGALQGVRPTCSKLVMYQSQPLVCHSQPQTLKGHVTSPVIVFCRDMASFDTPSADILWKTMAGVSQQGKKRGRARNLMRAKDLNRGQRLGIGPAKISWPGLTKRVITGTGKEEQVGQIEPMKDDLYQEYLEKLDEAKQKSTSGRVFKRSQHPLDRGWSGGKPLGRKFGPPETINKDVKFDNFESTLLEFKTVFKMTGHLGRVRRNSVLMVTGNRNGAVGFTVSPGKYGNNRNSLKRAVNKAGLRLVNVERYEDRTVYHDFFTQFGQTRIYVQQQPPGYGLRVHRGIRAICELAGIKDLYAKVEGSMNMQHVVKAFMLGLLRQRTHQALADEKQLHLVEMRMENDYFPRVVASPRDGKVRTKEEIGHNEILDFEMISFEGHLPMWNPGQPTGAPKVNPFESRPSWDKHVRLNWAYKEHENVRHTMRVEHGPEWGSVRSHLYPKYPECVERNWQEYIKMYKQRKGESEDD